MKNQIMMAVAICLAIFLTACKPSPRNEDDQKVAELQRQIDDLKKQNQEDTARAERDRVDQSFAELRSQITELQKQQATPVYPQQTPQSTDVRILVQNQPGTPQVVTVPTYQPVQSSEPEQQVNAALTYNEPAVAPSIMMFDPDNEAGSSDAGPIIVNFGGGQLGYGNCSYNRNQQYGRRSYNGAQSNYGSRSYGRGNQSCGRSTYTGHSGNSGCRQRSYNGGCSGQSYNNGCSGRSYGGGRSSGSGCGQSARNYCR